MNSNAAKLLRVAFGMDRNEKECFHLWHCGCLLNKCEECLAKEECDECDDPDCWVHYSTTGDKCKCNEGDCEFCKLNEIIEGLMYDNGDGDDVCEFCRRYESTDEIEVCDRTHYDADGNTIYATACCNCDVGGKFYKGWADKYQYTMDENGTIIKKNL